MIEEDISDFRLRRLLEYDPLGEAYKQASERGLSAVVLGFLNVHANADAKEQVLAQRRDSYWNAPFEYFREIAEEDGFQLVEEIKVPSGLMKEYTGWLFWYPRDGILLNGSSYVRSGGTRVIDSASMSFNCLVPFESWKELRGVSGSSVYYAAHGHEYRCLYSVDAREGLRFKLRTLRTHGAFVSPWVRECFNPLILAPEWSSPREPDAERESDAEANQRQRQITQERLLRMPQDLRECIAVALEEEGQ